jgi:hypothetical protein
MTNLSEFQVGVCFVVPVVAGSSPVSHPTKIPANFADFAGKGLTATKVRPFLFSLLFIILYQVLSSFFNTFRTSGVQFCGTVGQHFIRPVLSQWFRERKKTAEEGRIVAGGSRIYPPLAIRASVCNW